MERCPRHQNGDTMVTCMGCGRYFCRICAPIHGAGQYCPSCYEQIISGYTARSAAKKKPEVEVKPPASGKEEAEDEAAEGKLRSFLQKDASEVLGGLLSKAKKAFGRKQELPGVESEKAVSPVEPAGEKALVRAGGQWPLKVRGAIASWASTLRKFNPICLEDKNSSMDLSLSDAWWKLIIWTLAGALFYLAMVLLISRRLTWISVVASLIVAVGVAFSLNSKYGFEAGIVAMVLAGLAIMLGEMIVQVLFRVGVIESLDVNPVEVASYGESSVVYRHYYYGLIVHRLLPAMAVAFLVGWWPLPKRLGWKASGAGGVQEDESSEPQSGES